MTSSGLQLIMMCTTTVTSSSDRNIGSFSFETELISRICACNLVSHGMWTPLRVLKRIDKLIYILSDLDVVYYMGY